jgi:hypothetical protein
VFGELPLRRIGQVVAVEEGVRCHGHITGGSNSIVPSSLVKSPGGSSAASAERATIGIPQREHIGTSPGGISPGPILRVDWQVTH